MKKLLTLTLLTILIFTTCKKEEPVIIKTTAPANQQLLTENDLIGNWKIPFTTPQMYYEFKSNNIVIRDNINGTYTIINNTLKMDIAKSNTYPLVKISADSCYILNDTLYGKINKNTFFTKIFYK